MCMKRAYIETAAISDDLQHLAILTPSYHQQTLFYFKLKSYKKIRIPVEKDIEEIADIKFSKDNKLYYIFLDKKLHTANLHYYDPQSGQNTIVNLCQHYHIILSSTLNKYAIQEYKKITIKSLDQHYVVCHQFKRSQAFIIPSTKIIVVNYANDTEITQHCNFIIYSRLFSSTLRETKRFKQVKKGDLGYICQNVMNMKGKQLKGNDKMKQNTMNNQLFFFQKQIIIKEVRLNWKYIQIRKRKGILLEF